MYGLVLDKLGHLVNSLSSLIAMTGTGIPKYLQPECTGGEALSSIHELKNVCGKHLGAMGVDDPRFAGRLICSKSALNRARAKLASQHREARKNGPQGSDRWLHSNLALEKRVDLVTVDAATSSAAASRSRRTDGLRCASAQPQHSRRQLSEANQVAAQVALGGECAS